MGSSQSAKSEIDGEGLQTFFFLFPVSRVSFSSFFLGLISDSTTFQKWLQVT